MSKDKNDKHLDGSKKAAKAYLANLEITKIEYELASLERTHETEELTHKLVLAGEQNSGTFRLYSAVDMLSVERLRLATGRYAAAYPDEPITLVISSPGGSVFDGWVLFDHLRALSAQGHKITTVVRGMAGSMAAILTQAGDKRVIGPESYLVIHEPSSMAWGKTSDLIDELDVMKRLTRQAEDVFARRSKLSAKEIKAKTLKKDWYVDAKQSKALGFVDAIG
jgi:ATP-dependent protease ClpP protease subunit